MDYFAREKLAEEVWNALPSTEWSLGGYYWPMGSQGPVADRVTALCREAGFSEVEATVFAEALVGFVSNGGGRYGNLDHLTLRVQDKLVAILGGTGHDGVYILPESLSINPLHLEDLLEWFDAQTWNL